MLINKSPLANFGTFLQTKKKKNINYVKRRVLNIFYTENAAKSS